MGFLSAIIVVAAAMLPISEASCDDADGEDPVALGAVHCADEHENEYCHGPGTVYYGYGTHWVTKELSDGESVLCSNGAIGCDPLGGERKDCYILEDADPMAAPTEFHCAEHGCDDQLLCDEDSGECLRNCEVFQIDEFLLDCSAEWESNGNTVDAMATSIAQNSADITTVTASASTNADDIASNLVAIGTVSSSVDSNAADISANAADIGDLSTEMSSLATAHSSMQSSIDAIETALSQMAALSAHAQAANVDAPGPVDVAGAFALSTKDWAFISLLVVNAVLIIGVVTACFLRAGGRTKYHAVEVVSD